MALHITRQCCTKQCKHREVAPAVASEATYLIHWDGRFQGVTSSSLASWNNAITQARNKIIMTSDKQQCVTPVVAGDSASDSGSGHGGCASVAEGLYNTRQARGCTSMGWEIS